MIPSVRDRLAGAVWGHLLGDAIGVPYEFGPPRDATEVRWPSIPPDWLDGMGGKSIVEALVGRLIAQWGEHV
jgi:hypothetical protein